MADVLQRTESESYFYADVFRVVALVLGADRLPQLEPDRRRPGWRRDVAALIREVMASTARPSGPEGDTKAGETPRMRQAHGEPARKDDPQRPEYDQVMVAITCSYQVR